jgi:hypothetical protein
MKEKEEVRSYFNLVRAVAILEIFFYHIYDFSYGGFGTAGGCYKTFLPTPTALATISGGCASLSSASATRAWSFSS